jgi:hypothetical protein
LGQSMVHGSGGAGGLTRGTAKGMYSIMSIFK